MAQNEALVKLSSNEHLCWERKSPAFKWELRFWNLGNQVHQHEGRKNPREAHSRPSPSSIIEKFPEDYHDRAIEIQQDNASLLLVD